jgi:formylglycine-generating enzyme required for sulfatase activity
MHRRRLGLLCVSGLVASCSPKGPPANAQQPAEPAQAPYVVAIPAPTATASAPNTMASAPHDDVVRIPGGTFEMGWNDGDSDAQPIHPVTVETFEMDPRK